MHDNQLPEAVLGKRLGEAAQQVQVGAVYMHYKGKRYQVTGLAIQEADDQVCVIYQALYGQQLTFTRPLSNWIQTVEQDGKQAPRFAKA